MNEKPERLDALAKLGDEKAGGEARRQAERRHSLGGLRKRTGTLPAWARPFAGEHGVELLRLVESLDVLDETLLDWHRGGDDECATVLYLLPDGTVEAESRFVSAGSPISDWRNAGSIELFTGCGNIAHVEPLADALRDNAGELLLLWSSWTTATGANGIEIGIFDRDAREWISDELREVECPFYQDAATWLDPVDDLEIVELVEADGDVDLGAAVDHFVAQALEAGEYLADDDVERVVEDRYWAVDSPLD